MLKSCLLLALLGCFAQINSENVPAIIWGGKSDGQFPALHSLSADEFVTFVKSQATGEDSKTIVFVEKRLSVEDLTQCRECYANLRKVEKKTYLTAVDDPVKTLESSSSSSYAEIQLTGDADDDLKGKLDKAANSKLVFVYLDDVESRADFVKHDELISKFYSLIASKGENVIAIYTGRQPSFSYSKSLIRKTRDTSAKQTGNVTLPNKIEQFFSATDHVIVAISNLRYHDVKDPPTQKSFDVTTTKLESNMSADKLSIGFHMEVETVKLDVTFVLTGGNWEAREVQINSKRFRPHAPFHAYNDTSFGCTNLTLTDASEYYILENFQIQPWFGEGKAPELFGRHNDCTGFFSPTIWASLFVIFLALFILSWGFMMLMDIRTMDRFDDPKGKTITINAQE